MTLFRDGLDRAVQQAFTRPIPKSAGAQMRYLVKQLKGTRAVAGLLGVSQRTVERYVKDQIRRPRADLAQRLEDAVRQRWQPRIRAQARKQATTSTGLVLDTRSRFQPGWLGRRVGVGGCGKR
jgi:transcriptional regulator with XRE-family HTH domain